MKNLAKPEAVGRRLTTSSVKTAPSQRSSEMLKRGSLKGKFLKKMSTESGKSMKVRRMALLPKILSKSNTKATLRN